MGNTQARERGRLVAKLRRAPSKDGKAREELRSFVELSFINNHGQHLLRETYEIDEKNPLGAGSFGKVFLAKSATGVVRAVKQVKRRMLYQDPLPAIRREVDTLRAVNHPNVGVLYETFDDADCVYLVMEYLAGGTLTDRMRGLTNRVNEYSEPDIAALAKQMFEAVRHLHYNGVVHRDVKGDNFMFERPAQSADGTDLTSSPLKLIDFGLAAKFSTVSASVYNATGADDARFEEAVGTPYYCAPELITADPRTGKPSYGPKCDVWSCGVLVYELLAGDRPFNGTIKEIFKAIRSAPLIGIFDGRRWPTRSAEARAWLQHVLRRNPEERLNAHQVLTSDYLVMLVGRPSMAQDRSVQLSVQDANASLTSAVEDETIWEEMTGCERGRFSAPGGGASVLGLQQIAAKAAMEVPEEA